LIRFERIRTGSGIARCNLLSFTKIFALTKINLGLDKGVEKPAISETLILLKKPLWATSGIDRE